MGKSNNSIISRIKKIFTQINKKSSTDHFDRMFMLTISGILAAVIVVIIITKFSTISEQFTGTDDVVQEYSHTNQFQLRTYGEDLTENMENMETPENEPVPVCVWGDSYSVAGNATIPSFPAYLSKYCKRIVYNVAVPKDNLEMIAARQGGVPMYISPCDIKRDKAAVEITLTNDYNSVLTPDLEKNGGLNPVIVDGVEGVVFESGGRYYFNRSESGGEKIITDPKTIVDTKAMRMRRGDITLFFVGDDDVFEDTEKTVEIYVKMAKYLETDKFLVVGPVRGDKDVLDKLDARLEETFGSRFYNLRKYLCTEAVDKFKLELSDEEKKSVEQGILTDGYFLDDGYFINDINDIAGYAVFEKMNELGYFNQ